MKTLRIYACGGAGINIAKSLGALEGQSQEGFADVVIGYVDTSRSNLPSDLKEDVTFVLPGVDGSGKIRKQNYQEISNNIPSVLDRFPAGDFNVVIHSASGGSGSVFGPLVADYLVAQGHPTVTLLVGSWESLITITNTINTIRSLDNMARSHGHPLAFSFFNNEDNSRRKEVDAAVKYYVGRLACLVAGTHPELDSSDIANWLRYDRNPNNQTACQLVHLDIVDTDEEALEQNYPISIASLHTGDSIIGSVGADYQCAGILSPETAVALNIDAQHYMLSVNDLPELIKRLEERKAQLIQKQQSRPKTQSLAGGADSTEDGLIL